jgi:leader peptidase (prepilin peptidase) / N-methyltransferase
MEIFWQTEMQIIVFIFGLIVGSFLNCVVYRLDKEESFLKGRSYCPKCNHKLNWKDLIPVFSFIFLKGKCRYCKSKISPQYPIVEISTGLIFLLIYNFQFLIYNQFIIFNLQSIIDLLYLFVVSSLLIIIFISDLKTFIIPDKVLFPAIGVVFAYCVFEFLELNNWLLPARFSLGEGGGIGVFLNYLFSALAACAFFLAIYLVSRGTWMGFGDVKLAFFMGLFLGFPQILVALFLSFFSGAIIGVGLMLLGKKRMKSEVPFGPFLIAGTFVAFFWGQTMASWYFNLIGI